MTGEKNLQRLFPVVILLSVILGDGCTSSSTSSRSSSGALMVKMQEESYVIKKGDQIEISVWGYPEFQTTTHVKESGTITIPLAGEIRAAGLPKRRFIEEVRKKLSEFIKGDAEITVSVSSAGSQKVSVLGAVTRQDNYPVTGAISLLEALSSAGGTTVESDISHVKILRNGRTEESLDVDVAWYLESGNLEAVPKVFPGDVVYVPKKENVIRSFSDFLRDAVLLLGTFRVFY